MARRRTRRFATRSIVPIQELARARVDPVQVLEDHEDGPLPRQRFVLPQQRLESLFSSALGGRGRQQITRGGGQREKLGEKPHIFRRRCGWRQQRFELVELLFQGIFTLEEGRPSHLRDHRMERAVLMMR